MKRIISGLALVLIAGCGCNEYRAKDAWTSFPVPRTPSRPRYRQKTARRHETAPAKTAAGYPVKPDRRDDGFDRRIQSGILTAGSLDDLDNPDTYKELTNKLRWGRNGSVARKFIGSPTVICVTDKDGRPIGGADLQIDGAERWSTLRLRTKSNGQAVLMPFWDGVDDRQLRVRVTAPGSQETIETTIYPIQSEKCNIELQQCRGRAPRQLDMAFVIDCTGSMSDELEYLKVEIESIVETISRRFPGVRPRFALVAYRDRGDRYVTRVYDFTTDLDRLICHLGDQSANGGGDYPEAMHAALDDAAERLPWRAGNVARVAFLMADAPPHDGKVGRTFSAVDKLRRQGVAIYPVASSGVKDLAEFTMRTEALLTGSDYLFLTDDSGVGNAHEAPTADKYNVEVLRDLMVRMIAQEICGLKFGPRSGDVIRTAWGKDAWQVYRQ